MKSIVLIDPPFLSLAVDYLSKRYNVHIAPDGREETLIAAIHDHGASGLISNTAQITSTLIKNCPGLLVVGQGTVGVDNIDVAACGEAGIVVVHAPESNYISVAEHTIMSILALSRHLTVSDKLVRQGDWAMRSQYLPHEIHSRTLFLIGTGRSAQETARLAKAFHMNVKVYSRNPHHDLFLKNGIEVVDCMETGLKCADYVSLHVPLNDSTYHLISSEQLSLMKNSACLINMSRGAVVDESALHESLSRKAIAAAALDVLTREPPDPKDPLFLLPNIIFTPHTGGDTHEALRRSLTAVVEDVDRVLSGIPPVSPANLDVLLQSNCRFLPLT